MGFLTLHGIESGSRLNYTLGLEDSLRELSGADAAGMFASGCAVTHTIERGRLDRLRGQLSEASKAAASEVGRPMADFADRLGDYVAHLTRKPNLSRREYLSLSALALVSACGGNSSSSTPTGPTTPTPGELSGTVTSLDGKPVTGTIEFMGSTSGPILGTGAVNGSYNVKVADQSQIALIKRVRIRGDAAVCNTEINYSGTKDFKVLDRKLGIGDEYPPQPGVQIENPSFYDIANRFAFVQALPGLKKATADLTLWADANTIGTYQLPTGHYFTQNPEERLAILKAAIAEIYPFVSGRPWDGNIRVERTLPTPGNGNLVFRFDYAVAGSANPTFDGHRCTGGMVGTIGVDDVPNVSHRGTMDRVEIAGTVFLFGENDVVRPSLANDVISGDQSHIQTVDRHMRTAADFETLGTKKAKSFDGIWIESYEPPL